MSGRIEPSLDEVKYWKRFPEPMKQFGYYNPYIAQGAAGEARKPLKPPLELVLQDDISRGIKKLIALQEEQRADGKTRAIKASAFGGTATQTITSFTRDRGTINSTTGGKNLIQVDFVTGEYSGIPANTPVYVPYKKLFSLQIVNGAGDIKASINEGAEDKQAIIEISANSSFTHGMFQFPTVRRVSVINNDSGNKDSSVQLIWVT
jgi:hypothetical protein